MVAVLFQPILRFTRINFRSVAALALLIVIFLAAATAPLRAATLRGSVYDAMGIDGLLVGGISYDLTFHDTQGGSWFDTFSTRHVTSALTAISTESLARAVLGAVQDFVSPLGPIQVNGAQDILALAYASDGTDIHYMTTLVGNNNWGGVYGSFQMDAVDGDFYHTVSLVTVQRSAQSSPSFAPTPVPVPPAGIALIGALGLGAWVTRRRG